MKHYAIVNQKLNLIVGSFSGYGESIRKPSEYEVMYEIDEVTKEKIGGNRAEFTLIDGSVTIDKIITNPVEEVEEVDETNQLTETDYLLDLDYRLSVIELGL